MCSLNCAIANSTPSARKVSRFASSASAPWKPGVPRTIARFPKRANAARASRVACEENAACFSKAKVRDNASRLPRERFTKSPRFSHQLAYSAEFRKDALSELPAPSASASRSSAKSPR